jgi:hypothetical protein
MLPVETEFHLVVKVGAEAITVNDLAAFAGAKKHELACELMERLLWDAQEQQLARVLSGEAEVVCTRCGVVSGEGHAGQRGGAAARRERHAALAHPAPLRRRGPCGR